MTNLLGNRSHAVRAQRASPKDAADLFCTPPWATRALLEVLRRDFDVHTGDTVIEPAAGLGHMSEVLTEFFDYTVASDLYDYGYSRSPVFDFLAPDFLSRAMLSRGSAQWVITNPPFNLAAAFALQALDCVQPSKGVALLVRSVWSEGVGRWNNLFWVHPPSCIYQFSERVPMVKGRWDPDASSATAYAWFVWSTKAPRRETSFKWIAPGARARLTFASDIKRFASRGLTDPIGLEHSRAS